jgi:DNA-binding PadR family transcriptional regulator
MSYDNYFAPRRVPWFHGMGRHHGGRGFGHFAPGFMGGLGRGGGMHFRTGRKLAAADLQLVILALLAERPSHGYELIKAVEDRSGGFYLPSPGVIYPALTYLEEIGYVTVEPEGAKKLYRITDSGRQHLEQNREAVDAMLSELERIGRKMEHVRRVFAGEEPATEGEEEEGARRGGARELFAAGRALKMVLHQKRHCSREEASRIAAILKRATDEIRGK